MMRRMRSGAWHTGPISYHMKVGSRFGFEKTFAAESEVRSIDAARLTNAFADALS